jgi:hypothetical protein
VNECFDEAFRAGASPKLAVVGGWQQVASIVWIQVVGCPLKVGVQDWLGNGAEKHGGYAQVNESVFYLLHVVFITR